MVFLPASLKRETWDDLFSRYELCFPVSLQSAFLAAYSSLRVLPKHLRSNQYLALFHKAWKDVPPLNLRAPYQIKIFFFLTCFRGQICVKSPLHEPRSHLRCSTTALSRQEPAALRSALQQVHRPVSCGPSAPFSLPRNAHPARSPAPAGVREVPPPSESGLCGPRWLLPPLAPRKPNSPWSCCHFSQLK